MFLVRPLQQSLQRGLLKRRNLEIRPQRRRIRRQINRQLLIRSLRRSRRQPLPDLRALLDPRSLLRTQKSRGKLLHRNLLRRNLLQSQLRLHIPKSRHQKNILKTRTGRRWRAVARQHDGTDHHMDWRSSAYSSLQSPGSPAAAGAVVAVIRVASGLDILYRLTVATFAALQFVRLVVACIG